MHTRISSIALLLTLPALGCKSDEPPPPGGEADAATPGAPDAAVEPPPIDGVYRFVIEPFEVAPGTERQVCKTVSIPAGAAIDVVRLHATMHGVSHHFNTYKVLGDGATDPIPPGDEVVHDCAPASGQLDGSQAYIFGSGSPERTYDLPAGVAFNLPAKQILVLEQHVINATDSVTMGGVDFELHATTEPIEHHAEIGWFANWTFLIQTGRQSSTVQCELPYAIEMFGLTSHTHSLGVQFDIEHLGENSTEMIYTSSDWEHPLFDTYAPTRTMEQGDALRWTCHWDNTTGSLVVPGKESTDEMCIMFGYYYPRDTLDATPINCNKFPF